MDCGAFAGENHRAKHLASPEPEESAAPEKPVVLRELIRSRYGSSASDEM